MAAETRDRQFRVFMKCVCMVDLFDKGDDHRGGEIITVETRS